MPNCAKCTSAAPVDARLTAEIAQLLRRRALPVDVECHRYVCRVGGLTVGQRKELVREARVLGYLESAGEGRTYMSIVTPERSAARSAILTRVTAFQTSGPRASCLRRFPDEGELEMKLFAPRTGEPNDEGQLGRMSARYRGSLLGTPLGRCVIEEFTAAVLRAPLPAPVDEWEETVRLRLP